MATQHDINEDIFNRLNEQDRKLDGIAEDVAYMRGLMDGKEKAIGSPFKESAIINKQNAITVALAGLITTLGTVITSVFLGR